jgi:hypothetical protein
LASCSYSGPRPAIQALAANIGGKYVGYNDN